MAYVVPDMSGKCVVITGANTGIGRVTAERLADAGARVVIVSRSQERTQPVLDAIGSRHGGDRVRFVAMDLERLESVAAAAREIAATEARIDVLINNAGLAGHPGATHDGFERTFGVNHLGHFLFTELLLPRLQASAPSRIVHVASRAHYRARSIAFDALRGPTATRTGFPEYSVSKLANVLYASEQARRLEGTGVTVHSLHPGVVATDIWRRLPGPLEWLVKRFMITAEEGAETTLFCATSAKAGATSGKYWDTCEERRPGRAARDAALADELVRRSRAWVAPWLEGTAAS